MTTNIESDTRHEKIQKVVKTIFPGKKENQFRECFKSEQYINCTQLFFESQACYKIFFFLEKSKLRVITDSPPTTQGKSNKILYFCKKTRGTITDVNYKDMVSFGQVLPKNTLHSLSIVSRDIFFPVLQQSTSTVNLTEEVSKELVGQFDAFLSSIHVTRGNMDGKTFLPIPHFDEGDENNFENRSIVHSLEHAVVTWTNQIKVVLKNDPENLFKKGNPGPLDEIEFWKSKAINLNMVDQQLEGEGVQKILKFLSKHNSSYIPAFKRLMMDVKKSKNEANDNCKFMEPLRPFFLKMKFDSPEPVNFCDLKETFAKIFRLIYLIWKRSSFYNTAQRLVVLIRELCNDLIAYGKHYADAKEILNIEPDDALEKLEANLKICGLFKKYYFTYKEKVSKKIPDNPWRIPLGALFYRLDQFLERCRDILELIRLVQMFNRLSFIEIGGTKGQILTKQIREVYNEFIVAFKKFKGYNYDLLDVTITTFDDHFYEFKIVIKDLERKLSSILSQGFEDCNSVMSAFKLIECFHGLLDRDIIQSDLEKKNEEILRSYKEDLQKVQEIFMHKKDEPPCFLNLPPTSGALKWSQALIQRITEPMEKMKSLKYFKDLLNKTEGEEVKMLFESLTKETKKFEEEIYEKWSKNTVSLPEHLNHTLLKKEDGKLVVNFHPSISTVLKEVSFIQKINNENEEKREIPEYALNIFKDVETYKSRNVELKLVAMMYNKIQSTILDVERPLLKAQLDEIDELLQPGINTYNWKSDEVESFIDKVMEKVTDAYKTLETMKLNLDQIKGIFEKWKNDPFFLRKESRTVNLEEFTTRYEESKTSKEKSFLEDGVDIHQKVKNTFEALKGVEEDSKIWKDYLSFMNEVILEGIESSCIISIENLKNQMDFNFIKKKEINPLIEVSLNLDKTAFFEPKLIPTQESELLNVVKNWLNDFIGVSKSIKLLDDTSKDYYDQIKVQQKIQQKFKEIEDLFNQTVKGCLKYSDQFKSYSYLWEKNREKSFQEFLRVAESGEFLDEFEKEIKKYNDLLEKIETLSSSGNVGWLKIDSRPIKITLKKLCKVWSDMFTNFLQNRVKNTLTDVYEFMKEVDDGLKEEVVSGNVEQLKKIIRYIREVKNRMEDSEAKGGLFTPLHKIHIFLKKHETPLAPDVIKMLENGPSKWKQTYENSLNTRERLSPLQDAEAKKLKTKLRVFNEGILQFVHDFYKMPALYWKTSIQKSYQSMDQWNKKITDIEKKAKQNQKLQELFELHIEEYGEISQCREELAQLKQIWDMGSHVTFLFKSWMKTPFMDVDVDTLVREARKLRKRIGSFPVSMRKWDCYGGLASEVKNMLTALPLVQDLRSPAMRDRHWKELLTECNKPGNINPSSPDFSLKQLIELGLHDYEDEVRTIVNKASKEKQIEQNLVMIESTWKDNNFVYEKNEDYNSFMLGSTSDVLEELQDNQSKLQNMKSISFVEYFIEKVQFWESQLGTMEANMNLWKEVQTKWENLYPIFILSEDIKNQLPEDAERFKQVDEKWRKVMEVAKDIPNCLEVCTSNKIQKKLDSSVDFNKILIDLQSKLEKCEKALSDYLETKRVVFPRFYFVSPSDLIDILSKGSYPRQVMEHMTKIVTAIQTLNFDEDPKSKTAYGLKSLKGEIIKFNSPLECSGQVESWLNKTLETVRETLHHILGESHQSYMEMPKAKWLFKYPAQIVVTASRIWFTQDVNDAFDRLEEGAKTALRDLYKSHVESLTSLTQLVGQDISEFDREKIVTLIIVDVHNRDVLHSLIEDKAENNSVFAWQSQMRYSWDDVTGCQISIADANFKYNYEYIGNSGCLVITPLTDRCYITLTQALKLILGGAPAGPAGTGKTETTKDLGRALGMCVYVFNGSEQLDHVSLGNVFKGLSMSGCWGCFDEFNRVKIGVLSVVATQFKSILDALRAKKKRFIFQHEEIRLVDTVGVFITMNPGYAGRAELPENLKSLFRPCAMIVPDYDKICEIMLASQGFLEAKHLSTKFVTIYRLNGELLSKQQHYDWGLRAIKSVLVIAGSLRRAEPHIAEELILMRALRDTNLAKLSTDDKKIFLDLIGDLFPGKEIESQKNPKLETALKESAKAMNLQYSSPEGEMFLKKCLQFKELLDVRHSVFILGPAGSGKSCVWKNLIEANEVLGTKTVTHVMNPKAVSSFELYGFMHPVTRDWKDGLLSIKMREMSRSTAKKNKWIILDGDIDTEWIESMNTVMDDNKVLTLASNERIPLNPDMRMIFEIDNLKHASPATVSRAGILFLNATDINWMPLKESWVEKSQDITAKQYLERLFDKYCSSTLLWLKKNVKTIIPVREIALIETLCNLLDSLLIEENIPLGSPPAIYEYYFNFACVWTFGGCLGNDASESTTFNFWWKKKFTSVKWPEEGTVFDYFVKTVKEEEGVRAQFTSWDEKVEQYVHDTSKPFNEIIVSTAMTAKIQNIMDLVMSKGKPVLVVGKAGTGKTVVLKQKLDSLDDKYMFAKVNFNSNTDSKSLQAILERSLEKRPGIRFGPPGRKTLIYYLDDLNMPNPDKYGTQSSIALIRQHIDYGYWFNRAKMNKMKIEDCQYVASMNHKAGSFTVSERLQRHFMILSCSFPEKKDLMTIYHQILQCHLEPFADGIKSLGEKIVNSTLLIHEQMEKKFLPTAIKFYYKFNLRELSNVFQGLCLSHQEFSKSSDDFVSLWIHEMERVYSDRLFEEDVPKFKSLFKNILSKEYGIENYEEKFGTPLIYTPFMKTHKDFQPYTWADNLEELRKFLNGKLDEYNSDNAVMNLELFTQAIMHVTRIARIINNPRGNALLVGVGGSGKQSLSRLASSITGKEFYQIVVTSNYSIIDFQESFQNLFKRCGLKGEEICFIITDSQIVDQKMLVYINDFLSSGEIPNLFPDEDLEEIISKVTNEVRSVGLDYNNREVCMQFFLDKVKMNLHMILCLSPVGEHFRKWCRKFPAIINCTIIDFFHSWPEDALVSVANRFLQNIDVGGDEIRLNIAKHIAYVHGSVTEACKTFQSVERRYNYTTPKGFLELIDLFKNTLKKKREDLHDKIGRYKEGIDKLEGSKVKVNQLKTLLEKESEIVEEKRKVTEGLIKRMKEEQKVVQKEKDVATKFRNKCKVVVEKVTTLKEECKKDLEAAEPIVQEAKQALNSIKVDEIRLMKSYTKPKKEVARVTEAIFILKHEGKSVPRKITWNDGKKMMGNPQNFLDELKNFDKDNIPQFKVDLLKSKYLKDESFSVARVSTVSEAAGGMCKWVHNICAYHDINKSVEPKRQKEREASEKLAVEEANLKKVQDKVKRLQGKLDNLQQEYSKAEKDLNEILEKAKKTEEKIDLAERLTSGLGGEGERWGSNIESLTIREKTLVGDVLLASSVVSYLGAFTKRYRKSLVREKWIIDIKSRGIPVTDGIDPIFGVLTNEATVAQWNNDGLPSDKNSTENGAIVANCKRWPLMIDPQLQGIKWVNNMEAKNQIIRLQLSQDKYLTHLEDAIKFGRPVVIENIGEEIDSVLDPLLSQSIIRKGRQMYIQLGDKEVEYSPEFKLYFQTKLSNPHYRPEILAQTTPLNFMVTPEGLRDQLLSVVVNREKPELEEQRSSTLRQEREYKIQLKKCEDDLLFELTQEKGDILENRKLIENLEETKKTAERIAEAVINIKETSEKIEKSRQVYNSVSKRGAELYFLIDQLNTIDHMYQFSLESYVVIFKKALNKAKPSDDIEERVKNIIETVTNTVFNYVARGLFERHKLIFSTILCFTILGDKINKQQLDYLIKGDKIFGEETPEVVREWCSDESWGSIQALTKIPGTNPSFQMICEDLVGSWRRWKEWCEYEKPEIKPLPLEWKNLSDFAKLLVIRALRPDRLTVAVADFVRKKIGNKYIDIPQVDLRYSYDDSTPMTPLFFILSRGVDPISTVETLGNTFGFSTGNDNFKNISLGDGQEPIAENALKNGVKNGDWVMLNNLHLVPEWLPRFEKLLETYSTAYMRGLVRKDDQEKDENEIEVKPTFRLFLSAEPSKHIPIGVLQRSIKLTNEPPSGLNANLRRALMQFSDQTWENSSKQGEFKSILFSLCFYHATIIERKKYGPQGWNKNYPFNLGDLTTSVAVLNNYLEDKPKVPWEDLRYVIGQILYGGHITNDWDRRLNLTYLEKFVRTELVDGIELCIDFQSPPSTLNYKGFLKYIEENLPPESPQCFGLHPNAEIGFRTNQAETLFRTILDMQPRSAASEGEGGEEESFENRTMSFIEGTLETLPEMFDLEDISERLGEEDRTPYQNAFYQECEYMNKLLLEIGSSLNNVKLGIQGMLSITDKMQKIMDAIELGKVPEDWKKVSFTSIRNLSEWLDDLKLRNEQLRDWKEDLTNPRVLWLSRFFNPQSFLTAIMQSTSRKTKWPLDQMTLIAEITKKWKVDEIDSAARDGCYVTGLFLEGATWDVQQNCLTESKLKDLYPPVPIIHIRAVQDDKLDPKQYYEIPVYKTKARGPDFVFSVKLKTKFPPEHWIIRGTALLLDIQGLV